jgi:hypothetical protein
VHLESGDDVVILEGVAEEVTDDALVARMDKAYRKKYDFPLLSEEGNFGPLFKLRHKMAFAWLEKDFLGSPTRYQFT